MTENEKKIIEHCRTHARYKIKKVNIYEYENMYVAVAEPEGNLLMSYDAYDLDKESQEIKTHTWTNDLRDIL